MIKKVVESVGGTSHTLHCGACTACCRWGAVILQPSDPVEEYETEALTEEFRVLKRKEDGRTCWYLDEEKGCTIYDRRPVVCQAFDCRLYCLQTVGTKIVERDLEVVRAGRTRLEEVARKLGESV